MSTRYEGLSVRPQALVVSPEAPYPPMGGGALRTASLIDYLARRYNIDVITFREYSADRRHFPTDRIRDVLTLELEPHSKATPIRAARNFRRFLRARPPLIDRFSGFQDQIASWIAERFYSVVIAEHFWVAPYATVLREHAERLVLDLHNIESALQNSTAPHERWPLSTMFRRFGSAYEALEREWIPKFDDVLVSSAEDAGRVHQLAPGAKTTVYPNAIPRVEQPAVAEENAIAFSGNMEYHANGDAVCWFAENIWPAVHAGIPTLEWRLIGKNPQAVKVRVPGMKLVGPVEDAVRELAAAKVVVVPLRSGSGTRFKILEAWAAGRAVVSTTLGAEGLGARNGEQLLLADDAGSFVEAVQKLLADEELRRSLGAAGRKSYIDRFTTEAAWRSLHGLF